MHKVIILYYTICIFFSADILCQNIDLLGTLNPHPNDPYTDIWGYASNGREYALLGSTGGTSIIDVTNPSNPVEVAFIPGPLAPPYEWRDIKTHLNYAYIVSEGTGQGSGMQIVDLSNLPSSASLVGTYNATFTSAHNMFIADGYAYVVGTSSGGMHILNLADPTNPVQTAYYSASGYIHDVYVWNDTAYASSNNTYDVVSVLNKSNPQLISMSAALPGIYAHSGWLTEDKRYFVACEEFNVRDITIWDLQDRSTWDLVVDSWQTTTNSPVHNPFVLGDYVHISYYEDGYVVIDISDPENPEFAGQYDTNPGGSSGNYVGSWGVYPYLPSGITVVSDMQSGLYVCRFNPPVTGVDNTENTPAIFILEQNYPNPFNPSTKIKFYIERSGIANLSVCNLLGQNVATLFNDVISAGEHEVEFNASGLPSGIYIARLTSGSKSAFIKMSLTK
jgi:choice-of-anchor B domain-containing protein